MAVSDSPISSTVCNCAFPSKYGWLTGRGKPFHPLLGDHCFTHFLKKTSRVKSVVVEMCWRCIDCMEKSAREASFDELDSLSRIPLNDALDALAHVQRRKLLFALVDHNPQDDSPVVLADSQDEADAVEHLMEMQHVHLPKLVEYGFIDWNREAHEVTKGPNFDEIRPLLELLADHEDELPDGWL